MIKHIVPIALALALTGCGLLTPAVEQDLNQTSIAIACSLEEEELADPVLDADCQKLAASLPAAERASVAAHATHAAQVRAAKRPVVLPDGGVQ